MCRKLIYLIYFVLVLDPALTRTADADLVGWRRLDEGAGTMAFDSFDNGNDASFEGAPA